MSQLSYVRSGNSSLVKYISAQFPLSPELSHALESCIFLKTLRRKEIIVREGELCGTIYFILRGLTRAYIVRENKGLKKDITLWISIENEFETAVEGFFNGKPAKENIQALEECKVEAITASDLEKLANEFPEVHIVIRKLMQEYYIGSEERSLMGRLTSAEEKYEYLLEIRPHLLSRVPLKYIASFLGIRLETLSRLRNKRSRKKAVAS